MAAAARFAAIFEMHRLRQDDDRCVGIACDHQFAEHLIVAVEVAKIATAVEDDRRSRPDQIIEPPHRLLEKDERFARTMCQAEFVDAEMSDHIIAVVGEKAISAGMDEKIADIAVHRIVEIDNGSMLRNDVHDGRKLAFEFVHHLGMGSFVWGA